MSESVFFRKWIAQLKALKSDYDVTYEVSKEYPIKFQKSEDIKLSFVNVADTHLIDKDIAMHNLANIFEDIANSSETFDALLMAGDLAEYGRKKEYARFFNVFDKQKISL